MKLSDAIRKRIKFYLKEKNMNIWKLFSLMKCLIQQNKIEVINKK